MMVVSMTLVEPRPRRRAEASISMESPPVCVDGDAGARAPTLRLLGGATLDAGLPALVAPEAPEHVLQQLLARVRASAESPPAAPRTAR